MASYGPGIGNYGRRPNLGAGIGRGLSSLADRLREIEGQKIRANEIAGERAYETERSDLEFQRGEESALARELRGASRDDARFQREEQSDIAREQRGETRLLDRENREVNSLATALRQATPGLNSISNADQTVAPGTFEGFGAAQSVIASRNPRLMEGLLTDLALEPRRQAQDLGMYRQKAAIDREFNPPAPRPYNAPDRITDAQGRVMEVLPNGTTRFLKGPDGQPITAGSGTGAPRRKTQYEQQREAFARMARAGAQALGDLDTGDNQDLSTVLGMQRPTPLQRLADAAPFDAGNFLLSGDYQQRESSAFQIADSYLRFTSGAAVPEPEVRRFARAFTPRPGDKPETLTKKRNDRKLIVQILEGTVDESARASLSPESASALAEIERAGGVSPDVIDRLYDEVP